MTFNEAEFQTVVDDLLEGRVNEGMFDKYKTQIDFIKGIAANLKIGFKELLKMFKNKYVVSFFKAIKWSFATLFKILKQGHKAYQTVSDVIFGYLADNKVAKWTQSKLDGLDEYLQTHPKTKRLAGLAVSGMLVYIWLNMSFTGDIEYDMNFTDVIEALAGNFSIASIFAGPEGIKLLTLFATGMLFGLSFPWIGATSVHMIGGVLTALNNKFKVIKLKIRESMIRSAIAHIDEKVSRDCATGNGSMFKIGGWIVGRTSHLDDKRPPSEKERDDGFFCQKFVDVVKMFKKKRPMNINDGKWHLIYKDEDGFQNCLVAVNNEFKTMTFVTIMQLNKSKVNDYNIKAGEKRLFIGSL